MENGCVGGGDGGCVENNSGVGEVGVYLFSPTNRKHKLDPVINMHASKPFGFWILLIAIHNSVNNTIIL